jgi:hypothetical protein
MNNANHPVVKSARSIGFFKLVAASAFFVSVSMSVGAPIKFHGRTADQGDSSGVITVNPNEIVGIPGAWLGSDSIGPTTDPSKSGDPNVSLGPIVPVSPKISAPNIAPIPDPSGGGDPNISLGPIVPVSPKISAPNIAPIPNPTGIGDPNVPQGIVNTAPDGGSSIEMLSIGLVALLVFSWNMARGAIRARV